MGFHGSELLVYSSKPLVLYIPLKRAKESVDVLPPQLLSERSWRLAKVTRGGEGHASQPAEKDAVAGELLSTSGYDAAVRSGHGLRRRGLNGRVPPLEVIGGY